MLMLHGQLSHLFKFARYQNKFFCLVKCKYATRFFLFHRHLFFHILPTPECLGVAIELTQAKKQVKLSKGA